MEIKQVYDDGNEESMLSDQSPEVSLINPSNSPKQKNVDIVRAIKIYSKSYHLDRPYNNWE